MEIVDALVSGGTTAADDLLEDRRDDSRGDAAGDQAVERGLLRLGVVPEEAARIESAEHSEGGVTAERPEVVGQVGLERAVATQHFGAQVLVRLGERRDTSPPDPEERPLAPRPVRWRREDAAGVDDQQLPDRHPRAD